MKHICSPCGLEFKTEEEYLKHQCEKASGATPASPEFLKATTTPNFDEVSEEAIKRGGKKE